jgi:O-antigen/teichoic acid export membrane protein
MNWKTFVFRAAAQISVLSDAIILGWVRGAVAVTALLITQRLATVLRNQIQSLSNSVWPGLLELHGQGKNEAFRARILELTRLTSSLSMICLGTVGAYNAAFISRWVGEQYYSGPAVNILTSVNFWLWSVFGLWHWPIAGTGNIGAWTPYAIVSTVLNLGLSVVCTYWLGASGPLLGTLASFLLIYSWALPKLLRELFQIDPKQLWINVLLPVRIYAPFLCIVGLAAHAFRPGSYLSLLIHLSVATSAGLGLWWLFDLDSNSREQWKNRFGLVFARPRVTGQPA